MKISTILAGALLVASSEAWEIKFYGKEDGERKSFSVNGKQKVGCQNLENKYTDIVVDKFHWDPATPNFPDTVNAFIAYDTKDCTKSKGSHVIEWLGEKERNKAVDTPQKIMSFQAGGGSDAD